MLLVCSLSHSLSRRDMLLCYRASGYTATEEMLIDFDHMHIQTVARDHAGRLETWSPIRNTLLQVPFTANPHYL